MSLKPITNAFSDLVDGSVDVDHSESTSVLSEREREYRKAQKKLREIVNIRELSDGGRFPITKEQEEKLSRESEWWKIIDLYDNPPGVMPPAPTPKSKSKLEKERKMREKKERKAEAKRQHEERRKEEARKYLQRLEEERNERLAKEHAERSAKERSAKEHSKPYEKIKTAIHTEYLTLYEKTQNPNKVFHKLSLKYHPDKNNGKEDWAKIRFQFLNEIHSEYV